MFTEEESDAVSGTITVSTPSGIASSANAMKNYMCSKVLNKIRSTGFVKAKRFEETSGNPVRKSDLETRLSTLSQPHKEGIISDAEYQSKRTAILNDL
jgi:hypothetical protein